jgi:sugar phosphate isomerase/epimerase
MIPTCFSTIGCPDWTFSEFVSRGQEAGFDGVEIRLVERETDLLTVPELAPTQLAQRRHELAESGFRVCGLASSVSFDSPDATERAHQCVIGRAYLDLAAELEADFVRVFGDVVRDELGRDTTIQQVAEGLTTLGEYASTLDLDVIIETHGDFSQSDLVAELLEQVPSSAVGVLWDTHHPWRFYGEPLATTFARYAGRVRHTHWKDSVTRRLSTSDTTQHQAAHQAHELMSGHRHADYVLFGGGEFPVVDCLKLLDTAGYQGWYSYEWEKMWHPELEPPELAFPLFPDKLRQLHSLATAD